MPVPIALGRRGGVLRRGLLACLAGIGTLLACDATAPRHDIPEPVVSGGPPPRFSGIDFATDVKPILDGRCVACHACYDAPCQLKATAPEGLARGASKQRVYHSTRLWEADPTRLFVDAEGVPAWRDKGFFPVLGERRNGSIEPGLVRRYLELKERHPLPVSGVLPDTFTIGLGRENECPTLSEFDGYERRHPDWGMPYALPALADDERDTLVDWLDAGAPFTDRTVPDPRFSASIERWEAFLNRPTNRGRLSARYLFEHLYQAHLYFPDISPDAFFRVIRSSRPPGEPLDIIATHRPFDDPGVDRVYYRLVPERETIVYKTHNPYALDAVRLARLESLFFGGQRPIEALPGYDSADNSNPFVTFAALSVESRYRFMLDEARFTIANYIRGSVCRGRVAVSVIRDRFWVVFLDPDSDLSRATESYLPMIGENLALANGNDGRFALTPLLHWRHYEKLERRNHELRDAGLAAWFRNEEITLDTIWDGDGTNRNAALTVFRHRDNASVELGLLGRSPPDTAWVIDYPLLERIHYLLVAGYDVFGTLGHQLTSRLHMDFLRMQGEKNLLGYVPPATRERTRRQWYRGAPEDALDYMRNPEFDRLPFRGIDYRTDDPLRELYGLLRERLAPVRPADDEVRGPLARLATFAGERTRLLREFTLIRVDGDRTRYVSMLRDTAHLNMSSVFDEADQLVPAENAVTVLPGIRGAYPNSLMRVREEEVPAFVERVLALEDGVDYARLMTRFGIRRTDPRFWASSDELHARAKLHDPTAFGYLDYSRLENR